MGMVIYRRYGMKRKYYIKCWVPCEHEEIEYMTLAKAKKELEFCECFQPENKYEIEEA